MRGTLTGQRYVDDILRPHVGPFLNGLPGTNFQQDNARPHTARVAQDFLRHFQTLPWSASSPNLSPVEHVWDQLKRQMPSCHSVHDLELADQVCLAKYAAIVRPSLQNSPVDAISFSPYPRHTRLERDLAIWLVKKDLIDDLKIFGMSSRHHIDDFMRGRIIERSKKGENNRCCQGSSTSLTALFHGCGSHLKLLECSRRHGEVVLEVRRPQKTDISSYQQKEQAHHSSAGGKSVSCLRKADLPKTVARRLRGGGIYARRPVVCVPLTRQHRTARLQRCREHQN
ncbi:DDE_3 domain-containing protein [Trichonephila clavipes]|nr:DDE_3 domain-containing protein [Trichonephila clavipes]